MEAVAVQHVVGSQDPRFSPHGNIAGLCRLECKVCVSYR